MKVALVHDYLKEYGGAERVVEALHEIFPDAPLYTAYVDLDSMPEFGKHFKDWDIRTSVLQNFPSFLISPFRVFAPMIFEAFDLSEYDLVISSCNTYFSKAVIIKPGSLHISYIHTPPRYLYGYTTSFNYKKNPISRILGEIANHFLRIYDFETSQRPDILVANSKNVQDRIKKFYRRNSVVIYPPVDVQALSRQSSVVRKSDSRKLKTDSYFLSVGRLVRGKGIDKIVEVCTRLGLPLKVVGDGPELKRLQSISDPASPKLRGASRKHFVEFLGQVNDDELPKLYANAKATILASEDEDFGIVPVESMACGTPVIAPKEGGFLETVADGKTGEFFINAVITELMKVLEHFDPSKYGAEDCRKQAEKFSKERFKKEILDLVEKNFKKI